MIRNLRTLVLSLGAVFLLGALWASSASANPTIWFEGEAGIQTVTGEQEPETWDLFTITPGPNQKTTTCTAAHYTNETSTVDTTESEIEVTPTYDGCTTSGLHTIVKPNGCDYRFHTPVTNGGLRTANVAITCPAGKVIEVTPTLFGTSKCTVTVPPQTPKGHAIFTNTGAGSGRDVTVNITLEGIKYTEDAGTGFEACANGGGEDGTYTGKAIVRGRNHAGEAKGVWIDA